MMKANETQSCESRPVCCTDCCWYFSLKLTHILYSRYISHCGINCTVIVSSFSSKRNSDLMVSISLEPPVNNWISNHKIVLTLGLFCIITTFMCCTMFVPLRNVATNPIGGNKVTNKVQTTNMSESRTDLGGVPKVLNFTRITTNLENWVRRMEFFWQCCVMHN